MQEEIALNSFLLMAYSISRYTFSGTQDEYNQSSEMNMNMVVASCSTIENFLDPADRSVLQPYLDAVGMHGGLC